MEEVVAARSGGVDCRIIPFPPARRVDLIRKTANELARRKTERGADSYRGRVADRLFVQLAALGMSDYEQDEAVGAFFNALDGELAMLADAGKTPVGIY